ncbi:MazG-like family protein [Peptococcaceae bacterium 1198_IL3148]
MFPSPNQDSRIAQNIKIIDWLKADLLASLSALFKAMVKGSEERILDALASLIITTYVLGRRLGISFSRLDIKINSKLRQSIEDDHQVERWYGDLTDLLQYQAEKRGD